jgi:Mn-containing catalase
MSTGTESKQGRWASGPSIDGKGTFEYLEQPEPLGEAPMTPPPGNPLSYGTMETPTPPTAKDRKK